MYAACDVNRCVPEGSYPYLRFTEWRCLAIAQLYSPLIDGQKQQQRRIVSEAICQFVADVQQPWLMFNLNQAEAGWLWAGLRCAFTDSGLFPPELRIARNFGASSRPFSAGRCCCCCCFSIYLYPGFSILFYFHSVPSTRAVFSAFVTLLPLNSIYLAQNMSFTSSSPPQYAAHHQRISQQQIQTNIDSQTVNHSQTNDSHTFDLSNILQLKHIQSTRPFLEPILNTFSIFLRFFLTTHCPHDSPLTLKFIDSNIPFLTISK